MRSIYRFGIIIALIAYGFTVSAQGRAQKIYDELSGKEGFTSFSITKTLLDVVNLNLSDEGKKVTGDFKEMKILLFDRSKADLEPHLIEKISKSLDRYNYTKVEDSDSSKESAEIWIDGKGNKVKECHILVKDGQTQQFTCMVSFYGNFDVNDTKILEKIGRNQAQK